LSKAKAYYRNGNYGLAERYYRHAIEARRDNAEAWLGLAAAYDQLKRFDLADKAYASLVKITGYTPTVLNNLAYHHMLKGNFARARRTLAKASNADPNNPYIRNNINLLKIWETKKRGGWEPRIVNAG
jgi:Flp pilus assembly protein TadD